MPAAINQTSLLDPLKRRGVLPEGFRVYFADDAASLVSSARDTLPNHGIHGIVISNDAGGTTDAGLTPDAASTADAGLTGDAGQADAGEPDEGEEVIPGHLRFRTVGCTCDRTGTTLFVLSAVCLRRLIRKRRA